MKRNKCNTYKKELEKYKQKYEAAKSGLTEEERHALIELICDSQLINIIPKDGYESEEYKRLEELKAKIRVI